MTGGDRHSLEGRVCVLSGADSAVAPTLQSGLEAAGAVVAVVPAVRSRSEATAAIATVRDRHGPVELLVCCSPDTAPASLEELAPPIFDAAMTGAFKSPFLLTQAVLGEMSANGFGRIVYVTSSLGILGRAYTAHLAAGARALIALARTVVAEESPAVTANTIAVGPIEGSALLAARLRGLAIAGAVDNAAGGAQLEERLPPGKLPTADDALDAVLWALQPSSGFLMGQTITVAGASELQVWP
jgi:3-oxoacyl-[acyl-carrier protein] reductase